MGKQSIHVLILGNIFLKSSQELLVQKKLKFTQEPSDIIQSNFFKILAPGG
jgi:hypothetical protein